MSGSIRQRIDELDALLAQGAITPAEHAEARRAALGLTAVVPPPTTQSDAAQPPPQPSSPPRARSPVVGHVMAQQLSSAAPFPSAPTVTLTDKKCRAGHKMALLQNVTSWVATQRGRGSRVRVICANCLTAVVLGDRYYACSLCAVSFCRGCVESDNRHIREHRNAWTTGLLDCGLDRNSCFDAFACAWCFQGMLCDRVQRGFPASSSNERGVNDDVQVGCTGRAMMLGCALFAFDLSTACVLNFFSVMSRQVMTQRYGIGEDACTTCAAGCLCRCLSDAQVHREMTIRGHFPGGIWAVNGPSERLRSMLQSPIVPEMVHNERPVESVYGNSVYT